MHRDCLLQISLVPILTLPLSLHHFPPSQETSLRSRSQVLATCEDSHQASHEKLFIMALTTNQAFGFNLPDHCWIVPGKAEKISKPWHQHSSLGFLHPPETKQAGSSVSTAHAHMWQAPGAPHVHCSPDYFSATSSGPVEGESGTLVNASEQLWGLQTSRKQLGVIVTLLLLFLTLSASSCLHSQWGGKDAISWNSTSFSSLTSITAGREGTTGLAGKWHYLVNSDLPMVNLDKRRFHLWGGYLWLPVYVIKFLFSLPMIKPDLFNTIFALHFAWVQLNSPGFWKGIREKAW